MIHVLADKTLCLVGTGLDEQSLSPVLPADKDRPALGAVTHREPLLATSATITPPDTPRSGPRGIAR